MKLQSMFSIPALFSDLCRHPDSEFVISWARDAWPVSFTIKPLFNVSETVCACSRLDRIYVRSSARLMRGNTAARCNLCKEPQGHKGLVSLLMLKAKSGLRRSRAFGHLWKLLVPRFSVPFRDHSLVDLTIFANELVWSSAVLKRQ
jgi:hypothetical protein